MTAEARRFEGRAQLRNVALAADRAVTRLTDADTGALRRVTPANGAARSGGRSGQPSGERSGQPSGERSGLRPDTWAEPRPASHRLRT